MVEAASAKTHLRLQERKSEPMKIEQAGINELDQLAKLFDAYRVFYGQASDLQLAREFLRQRMENQESVILMESQGRGFTQLYPAFSSVNVQRTWILNDLFVDQDARQQGIARALMQAAKAFAKSTGARGISLSTGVENTQAQALYESEGYRRVDDFYSYVLRVNEA